MARITSSVDALVASFAGPDAAKAAMAKLERAGIPAGDVHLLGSPRPTDEATLRRADERSARWVGRRWIWGAVPGALVGAVLLAVGVAVLWEGESVEAVIAAALGGAVAGASVGGLLALGTAAPRNPQAWDTYLREHDDEVCIAVSLRDPDRASTLRELLTQEGATSVERFPSAPVRRSP